MNRFLYQWCLFLSLFCISSAATLAQSSNPTDSDDVVKITTKLVRLDAVVTDKDGRQVRDLSVSDFVLLQDGKPQKITSLSYVSTVAGDAEIVRSGSSTGVTSVPPPRLTGWHDRGERGSAKICK